jgi:hypothetical protein
MKNTIKGGKSDKLSLKDIADKFGVSVDKIKSQIQKGIKIESEHTSDKEKATEIAMDHISEFPDYYDRLEKMEKEANKKWEDGKEKTNEEIKETKINKMNENNKTLIKKLLREELEEGKFGRMAGALSMAAATLGSPNIQAMSKDPVGIEKMDKVGVTKNPDGSFTSIAKTDGPTKEIAMDLAIGKAKIQIASALQLDSPEFDFDVIDVKFEKGRNNIICIVMIKARLIR